MPDPDELLLGKHKPFLKYDSHDVYASTVTDTGLSSESVRRDI